MRSLTLENGLTSLRVRREAGAHIWTKAGYGRQQGGKITRFSSKPITKRPLTLKDQGLYDSRETPVPPRFREGCGVKRSWRPVRGSARNAIFRAILGKYRGPQILENTLHAYCLLSSQINPHAHSKVVVGLWSPWAPWNTRQNFCSPSGRSSTNCPNPFHHYKSASMCWPNFGGVP
jgi:hypothetical protein